MRLVFEGGFYQRAASNIEFTVDNKDNFELTCLFLVAFCSDREKTVFLGVFSNQIVVSFVSDSRKIWSFHLLLQKLIDALPTISRNISIFYNFLIFFCQKRRTAAISRIISTSHSF